MWGLVLDDLKAPLETHQKLQSKASWTAEDHQTSEETRPNTSPDF